MVAPVKTFRSEKQESPGWAALETLYKDAPKGTPKQAKPKSAPAGNPAKEPKQ